MIPYQREDDTSTPEEKDPNDTTSPSTNVYLGPGLNRKQRRDLKRAKRKKGK